MCIFATEPNHVKQYIHMLGAKLFSFLSVYFFSSLVFKFLYLSIMQEFFLLFS